ncbi:hypothetical protein C2S53_017297 [Perilla frutescens var. hirtella]|uniref:SHSP domain-containing protein n=1 Tax=Perilla frutescens var. hirtella TaxID=608512 RepID=A0AAD4JNM2_PERFH|nr:hypothetical protein C2S53_017297 [Perilla frutescens var. hirtella]
MDARNEAATSTFEPSSDLIQEEDCNTLLLYLPGFTKDQLRVQLTRTRVLKISGTRPLTNNKWSSFQKDFPVPENCDTEKITAKFEDGILYVKQPKTKQVKEHKIEELPPDPSHKPAAKIDHPPPTTHDHHIKQEPKKTVESKEKIKGDSTGKKEEIKKTHDHAKKRHMKGAGTGDVESSDYSKQLSPAVRLKAVKQKMRNVLLLLFVFALGIYVAKLPWFSFSNTHQPQD